MDDIEYILWLYYNTVMVDGPHRRSWTVVASVSVKRRHSVFDAQNFGQNAQKKKDSASSDEKDFPVDAQFHMAVRQVDAVIA